MKRLVVKLGAELADISESMRLALERGTDRLVERLAEATRSTKAPGWAPCRPPRR
ncbi:hypothetical protein [Burkholderia gladioli]|nr:hypothetical protein [Burkholderia gladioli]